MGGTEEGGLWSAGIGVVSKEDVDGTDVTEVLTGVAVCWTEVGGNRTARTVFVSEEEVGGNDSIEVHIGVGVGGTDRKE